MTRLPVFLLEPDRLGSEWIPFAGARPLAELRAGAFRIWERWQRAVDGGSVAVVSPHTPSFADVGSMPLVSPESIIGPALVALATTVPVGEVPLPARARGLALAGRTVAWILSGGERWGGSVEVSDPVEMRGLSLGGSMDLVTACERLLEADCRGLAEAGGDGIPAGAVVLGDQADVVVRGATVEPQVIFDVRRGPIVIEDGALVRAGTRLEGPLYVGPHTWVLGGAVRHSSFGPHCRIHGEVAFSTFLGYANKSHDGFLGHSVVGQWVNLGAGTITSNLKNTYGEVRLDLPGGRLATGRTQLGTMFGDHAKTAIGTLLGTGSVIGTGANVFGGSVPRFVRPFAWGPGPETLDATGFLTIAERVMPRRGVEVTTEIATSLRAIHARLAA